MPDKKHRLHFLLDENFPLSAGEFLKSLGYPVTFFPSVLANRKYADENVLKFAKKQNCILLTKDADFFINQALVELVCISPGVVLFITATPAPKEWRGLIKKMLKTLTPKKVYGKILRVSLGETKYLIPQRN